MRTWMSECVVVLSFLPILLATGMSGSEGQAQANTRIASRTYATLTAAVIPAAAAATANSPATYVVQPGDTLSGIAARLDVPGGWPALYAANQALLGPDSSAIQPGTVLVLPGRTAPVRYTVRPGDTLSGIAGALAVPGGWPALYAANHQAIGTNPGVIQPGTVLIVPRQVASATTTRGRHRFVSRSVTSPRLSAPYLAEPPAATGTAHAHVPSGSKLRQAATGMPRWLVTMLLGVAFLIGAAFLAEPVVVHASRRRKAARPARITAGSSQQGPGPGDRPAEKPGIVIADYDRLVVIQCKGDDTVYVLRPPGEDPVAVLRVARLVLREHPYRLLAAHLAVSTSTQTGESPSSEPSRRPASPDGSGSFGLQGRSQSFGVRYRSEDWDQDLLRRDSTRAAT